jgi:lipoate-protein ligase A
MNAGRAPGEQWRWLDTGPCRPAYNMALDEALLEWALQTGSPVLRFYAWSQPAGTFGYFQHYAEVERLTPLRPLIRRTTGGGLVPHDHDWTYSLVFPREHSWYRLRAKESYQQVHGWLCRALARLGLETRLAPRALSGAPGKCFAGAEQYDVLWQGAKIAGAAQRRTRHGLLIQGSVQTPAAPITRPAWQAAMRLLAAEEWGIAWTVLTLPPALEARAEQLAREKYGHAAYNQAR